MSVDGSELVRRQILSQFRVKVRETMTTIRRYRGLFDELNVEKRVEIRRKTTKL